ncbi:hypothetical protein RB195_025094 [Necator americanus]|uniref:Uncharacterized protein n=1 Tax=Necator americanus TaxID=51031 RepID=A0ABR1EQW8_NECAM
MLLHLVSALTLLLASEDLVCHPFLDEFSTLRFCTTADLQYIELAVTEEYRRNVQAVKETKTVSYGPLVLNMKSPLNDAIATGNVVLPYHLAHATTYDFARFEPPKRLRRHQA